MDKRGVFFGLLLTFVVLFLSLGVLYYWASGQKAVAGALVSPKAVLEVRDGLELFEMREEILIRKSLDSAGEGFPSEEFVDSFRVLFVDGFMDNNEREMKDFLFEDLVDVGDVNVEDGNKDRNLVELGIYPKNLMEFGEDKIIFTRVAVGKKKSLAVKDSKKTEKINFPVEFEFEFEKSYVITYGGGKFLVDGR